MAKSSIAEANSPLFIRSPKPLKNCSANLKQSNCTTIAVVPHINISNAELLTDNELAKGMPMPRIAPENDMAAAVLLLLIS